MDHLRQKKAQALKLRPLMTLMVLLLLGSLAGAAELVYFYDRSCPHCARLSRFLEERIEPTYDISIRTFEIHNRKHAAMLTSLATALNAEKVLKEGTPAVFIGSKAFQGDTRSVMRRIEMEVRRAVREEPPSSLSFLPEETAGIGGLSLAAVITAAAADAVNPCAIAVLVLLLGTIMIASKGKQSRIIAVGTSFTATCFISYFLMGLGLFSAIQSSRIQHYIYLGVSVMAIILGLWNIKDMIWEDKFSISVPAAWQPRVKALTARIRSVPGAFGIGILISLFLLPCTSGPYIVIIGMLSSTATKLEAVFLLLLYNFIFVLPFLAVTALIGFGFTSTARVEKWRQSRFTIVKGVTGAVMLAIGVTLIVLMSTGRL